MNTPSHLIITAALRSHFRLQVPNSAILWGAVAPDLPLYLLSLGSFLHLRYFEHWAAGDAFRHMYQNLFYQDPLWIVSHNLLHSPVALAMLLFVIWLQHRRQKKRPPEKLALSVLRPPAGRWMTWFLLSCLLHSVIDILTHNDDGPLLFFPASWTIRFASPVSYWDPDHFGHPFSIFELGLDVFLLGVILWNRRRTHRETTQS